MVEPQLIAVVGLIGFLASIFSGLLGLGGGIVFAPALLYLPPLLGVSPMDMKTVAGLTVVQGLVACLFGGFGHSRHRLVSKPLVVAMGPTIMAASLAGSLASARMSNEFLLGVLAALALVGSAMMLLRVTEGDETVDASQVTFGKGRAVAIALAIGLLGGMVGQGGSFILIPLMLHILKLPTRVAIGSNLGVVFFACLAGVAGKAATGQVDAVLACALVLGALPGSQLGARMSRQTDPRRLRFALAAVIGIAAIRMWREVLLG